MPTKSFREFNGSFPGYTFRESGLVDHSRGCARGRQTLLPLASRRPAGSRFPVPLGRQAIEVGKKLSHHVEAGRHAKAGGLPVWELWTPGAGAGAGARSCFRRPERLPELFGADGASSPPVWNAFAGEGDHRNSELLETLTFSLHLKL